MDLIIRLKRPRNVDPFEALVFASKRRKTEKEDDDAPTAVESIPTILKFAGTLDHQEEDISSHIAKARQHDGPKSFSHLKSKDVIKRMRENTKKASKENRFKVINFSRAASAVSVDHSYAGSAEISKSPEGKQFTIIDVVHDLPTETSQEVVEEDGYVYSLYYADSTEAEVPDVFVDSLVCLEPLDMSNYPLYDYRTHEEDIIPDDEDDSNDENNWRNDYPDSDYDKERNGDDSDDSVGRVMVGLKLDSENELSGDEEDDDLPYGVDPEEVAYLGRSYASYKARVTEELKDTDSNDDDYENDETSGED